MRISLETCGSGGTPGGDISWKNVGLPLSELLGTAGPSTLLPSLVRLQHRRFCSSPTRMLSGRGRASRLKHSSALSALIGKQRRNRNLPRREPKPTARVHWMHIATVVTLFKVLKETKGFGPSGSRGGARDGEAEQQNGQKDAFCKRAFLHVEPPFQPCDGSPVMVTSPQSVLTNRCDIYNSWNDQITNKLFVALMCAKPQQTGSCTQRCTK